MNPEDLNTNLRSIAKCTGEVIGALGSSTAAAAQLAGYQSFGQVVETGLTIESNPIPYYGSYRGIKRKVKTFSGNNAQGYTFKLGEMNPLNLSLLLSADPAYVYGSEATDNARSAISATAGTDFAFGTTAAVPGYWYQVLDASGNHVKNITTLTIAGKTEGTDFDVDYLLGLVRFTAAEASDLTPTITCAAITSASVDYMKRFKPGQKYTFEGMFQVAWWDEDSNSKLLYFHEPFLGRLQVTAGPSIADNPLDMDISLDILDGSFFQVRA